MDCNINSTIISVSKQIVSSKNLMFTVFSYVDYDHNVRRKYMLQLNQKYRKLALDKEEESFNLLPKIPKTIVMIGQEGLKKLDKIHNLHDYDYLF